MILSLLYRVKQIHLYNKEVPCNTLNLCKGLFKFFRAVLHFIVLLYLDKIMYVVQNCIINHLLYNAH